MTRRNILIAFACALAIVCASSPAAAGVSVIINPPSAGEIVEQTLNQAGKWQITVRTTSTDPTLSSIGVSVAADNDDDIAHIRIITDSPKNVFLFVEDNELPEDRLRSVDLIERTDGVDVGAFPNALLLLATLETAGNVGSIRVTHMFNVRIEGDLTQGIEILPIDGPESARFDNEIRIRGDVLGDIVNPFSGIVFDDPFDSFVIEGRLGLPGAPVNVLAGGDITSLVAGEINATIDTMFFHDPADPNSPAPGAIGHLEVDRGPMDALSGEFNGSIRTRTIDSSLLNGSDPGFFFAGDFLGEARLEEDLPSDAVIQTSVGGLRGLIVLNNANQAFD